MEKRFTLKLTVLFALSFLYLINSYAQPTPPAGKQWTTVSDLTDEFSSWNSSKWFKSLWNYGEPVQMLAENSGVSNGNLWIKATLDDGATRWFETSRVMSKAKISYPMYTECSMRTAHISAYNTYWLNNGDINNRDEIDICENNSKPSDSSKGRDWPYTMQSQYFLTVDGNDERDKGNFDNRDLSDDNPLKGVKWNEAYHTLGLWWKDKNTIQFYLDGEATTTITTERDFTRELSIIWDLWTIDASWSGGIANKDDLLVDSINTMYVDWIHTYTLEDAPASITKTNVLTFEVYPNPTANKLILSLSEPVSPNDYAKIFNSQGQLMKTASLTEIESHISVSEFPKGIYYVQVSNGDKRGSKTFVKQ